MTWLIFLIGFIGTLMVLMFLGLPVAFSFLLVNFIFVPIVFGFEAGMNQMVLSAYDAVSKFSLTPLPLFILMGELLLYSGLVVKTIDALSQWLGRIPGRLSVLTVTSGALFASLSGSSIANTSMLGSTLGRDMYSKGYNKLMVLGPIMASGSLAVIMPHSNLAILMGSIGKIPVGKLLIATIVPGILMATLFILYIIFVNYRNPSLAPEEPTLERVDLKKRIRTLLLDVMPMVVLIVMTIVLIFFGLATPTESAALGAVGAFVLVILYRKMSMEVLKNALTGTIRISGMILLIILGSTGFSQLLAFTGASQEFVNSVLSINVPSILILIFMLLIVIFLGIFLEAISIMLITLPLFMPIVLTYGWDPIWFGIMFLICLDLGNLMPPVGLLLFAMKGVSPKNVTMLDIYKAVVPFVFLEILAVVLIMLIPQFAIWLPNLAR